MFLGISAVYLFFKYGLELLLPFLIAWMIAMAISPLAKRLAGKGKRGKAVSVILLFLLLSLIVLILALAFDRLIYEVRRLAIKLGEESEAVSSLLGRALDFIESITENVPFLNNITKGEELVNLREKIDSLIGNVISGFVTELSSRIPVVLGDLISAFPSFLLFIIVTLISSFYFCVDIDDIHRGIKNMLPSGGAEKLSALKRKASDTALKYLRAYVLIFFMTFGELFVGFSILRIDYSLLLAALISVVDILPVFGVGSVLIPWAVIMLISGNYYMGAGLLIIYGCVTVVRQIAEPRIVGGSIGLHPLVTLIFTYAGFKLFGFFGMILGPAFAIILKSFFIGSRSE